MKRMNTNKRHRGPETAERRAQSGTEGRPLRAQTARKNYEHYLTLARAKALAGDPVGAENYYQHAEHYLRSLDSTANEAASS